jgi:hypothetical protein
MPPLAVEQLPLALTDSWLVVKVKQGLGGWWGGGAVTVTPWFVAAVLPPPSVTVSPMVRVPAEEYVWLVEAPEPAVPSPQLHAQDATGPSGSEEQVPSTLTFRPLGVEAKQAVGVASRRTVMVASA